MGFSWGNSLWVIGVILGILGTLCVSLGGYLQKKESAAKENNLIFRNFKQDFERAFNALFYSEFVLQDILKKADLKNEKYAAVLYQLRRPLGDLPRNDKYVIIYPVIGREPVTAKVTMLQLSPSDVAPMELYKVFREQQSLEIALKLFEKTKETYQNFFEFLDFIPVVDHKTVIPVLKDNLSVAESERVEHLKINLRQIQAGVVEIKNLVAKLKEEHNYQFEVWSSEGVGEVISSIGR